MNNKQCQCGAVLHYLDKSSKCFRCNMKDWIEEKNTYLRQHNKPKLVTFSITVDEYDSLIDYCLQNNISKDEFLKEVIHNICN